MAGNADDLQANRLVHNDTCLLFWSTFRKHLLRTYAYSSTLQTSLDKGGLLVIGPNKMGTKKATTVRLSLRGEYRGRTDDLLHAMQAL